GPTPQARSVNFLPPRTDSDAPPTRMWKLSTYPSSPYKLASSLLHTPAGGLMTSNATQLNQLSNQFQQLSNLARQAGSNSPTSGTSAQYFNQLLSQMSQNLQAGGST